MVNGEVVGGAGDAGVDVVEGQVGVRQGYGEFSVFEFKVEGVAFLRFVSAECLDLAGGLGDFAPLLPGADLGGQVVEVDEVEQEGAGHLEFLVLYVVGSFECGFGHWAGVCGVQVEVDEVVVTGCGEEVAGEILVDGVDELALS